MLIAGGAKFFLWKYSIFSQDANEYCFAIFTPQELEIMLFATENWDVSIILHYTLDMETGVS